MLGDWDKKAVGCGGPFSQTDHRGVGVAEGSTCKSSKTWTIIRQRSGMETNWNEASPRHGGRRGSRDTEGWHLNGIWKTCGS